MKDEILNEVMKEKIISKENLNNYFNRKQIITKEEYSIYFNKNNTNESSKNSRLFPDWVLNNYKKL